MSNATATNAKGTKQGRRAKKTKTTPKTNVATKLAVGSRVNALYSDGEWYPGVVKKAGPKCTVEFDDGDTASVSWSNVKERRRGRPAMTETMTPEEITREVKELIAELEGSEDIDDKKRLRRALRRRGHTGGLGIRNADGSKG